MLSFSIDKIARSTLAINFYSDFSEDEDPMF